MKVYVWLPKGGAVGHAALELSNGTYISWWPDEEKKKTSRSHTLRGNQSSLDEDKHLEERDPDKIFEISLDKMRALKINEKAIEKWWEDFRSGSAYDVLAQNCCTVVYKALAAGGFPQESHAVWTPATIADYITRLLA